MNIIKYQLKCIMAHTNVKGYLTIKHDLLLIEPDNREARQIINRVHYGTYSRH